MQTPQRHYVPSPILSSVEAVCVDPKLVHEVWPSVSGLIQQVILKCGLGLFADVDADVLAGRALLWLAWSGKIEAAAVTQLQIHEGGRKVCLIVACGGKEPRRWVGLISRIEQYAKDENCDCVRIIGRKGWMRLLAEYRATRVVLEKELK